MRPASPLPLRALVALLGVLMLTLGALLLARPPAEATGQPDFLLPWQDGQTWLTGGAGFHNANDALDFFAPDTPLGGSVKCEGDPDWVLAVSSYYVLSAAAGTVVQASNASVLIDHGGGWFSRYYHMTGFVVEPDDFVLAGQRLAKPSTLGFCSSGPHNHFWVQGPNGETTRDVTLSGIPAMQIGVNEYISDTGNFEPGGGATPTPTPTAPTTDTPAPTASPTASPVAEQRGDANCDGAVNGLDATAVVRSLAGNPAFVCGIATADTDCDGELTTRDVLNVLLHLSAIAPMHPGLCPQDTATPMPTETPAASETPAATATPTSAAGER